MRHDNLLRRWVAFNLVGVLGVVVQLALLAGLVRVCRLHYLAATALAVEAAVLHNFLWHQTWTWRDRRGAESTRRRLARFHLLNGSISLIGNLALMRVLSGSLALDPVAANAVSIATCSLVSFIAGETMVFKPVGRAVAIVTVTAALLGLPHAAAAQPTAAALAAWAVHQRQADASYETAADGHAFFTHDALTPPAQWRQAAMRDVAIHRIDSSAPGASSVDVPDARIHHWVGATFLPRATLDGVMAWLVRGAGRESEMYSDVIDSRLISREGDVDGPARQASAKIFMRLRRASVLTVTYDTDQVVSYRRHGRTRASSRSVSTRIVELADPGTPREHEVAPGSDHGFLWRLNAYWRYEEAAGGVLIECESLSLSRRVPVIVKPLADPIVDRVARESLDRTLRAVKMALGAQL